MMMMPRCLTGTRPAAESVTPGVMGRPAGLEARAGRRDQRSFPMNALARTITPGQPECRLGYQPEDRTMMTTAGIGTEPKNRPQNEVALCISTGR
jgi:hypothetical protein